MKNKELVLYIRELESLLIIDLENLKSEIYEEIVFNDNKYKIYFIEESFIFIENNKLKEITQRFKVEDRKSNIVCFIEKIILEKYDYEDKYYFKIKILHREVD